MTSRIRHHLLSICALIFLSGCGSIEKEDVEIGWKGVAMFDRFLAASRFITNMGIPATSYTVLPAIPPPNDAMIFIPASAMYNQAVNETIDNWVYDQGGTAVYMLQVDAEGVEWADASSIPIQAFIDYEEIELQADEDYLAVEEKDDDEEDEEEYSIWSSNLELPPRNALELNFVDSEQFKPQYKTDFPNTLTFRHIDDDDSEFYTLSSYEHGAGHVHIISTALPFTNLYLNRAEHATLLWDLVSWHEPSEVQFAFSSDQSFWALLASRFPHALWSLAFLLTLWLWSRVKRFGPLFQTIDTSRNNLVEHLTATGYFFTKHRADTLIVDQLRSQIRESLARKVNLPLNTDLAQVLYECQEQEVLPPEDIHILNNPLPDTPKEQLAYLQHLQKLTV